MSCLVNLSLCVIRATALESSPVEAGLDQVIQSTLYLPANLAYYLDKSTMTFTIK